MLVQSASQSASSADTVVASSSINSVAAASHADAAAVHADATSVDSAAIAASAVALAAAAVASIAATSFVIKSAVVLRPTDVHLSALSHVAAVIISFVAACHAAAASSHAAPTPSNLAQSNLACLHSWLGSKACAVAFACNLCAVHSVAFPARLTLLVLAAAAAAHSFADCTHPSSKLEVSPAFTCLGLNNDTGGGGSKDGGRSKPCAIVIPGGLGAVVGMSLHVSWLSVEHVPCRFGVDLCGVTRTLGVWGLFGGDMVMGVSVESVFC